ncbi:hypothetical protein NPIL_599071 [Nephila pilipes]|uniref:Uncharacterized protein n=1 Tax=Nephila pilipes TaxID=299642 RepID=A0A8X6NHU6_NEPPI|nr:hypothetical protein NPIL_599071 [Nephila pilipes]
MDRRRLGILTARHWSHGGCRSPWTLITDGMAKYLLLGTATEMVWVTILCLQMLRVRGPVYLRLNRRRRPVKTTPVSLNRQRVIVLCRRILPSLTIIRRQRVDKLIRTHKFRLICRATKILPISPTIFDEL